MENGEWRMGNRAYAIRPYGKTETTHEAGVEAKLVLTIPFKKEFFYEEKKTI